jgi:hypothetical protein
MTANMTNGDLALALVLLTVAVALAGGWLYGHIMWKDGHEAGRLYERNRRNERRLLERAAPPPAIPAQFRHQDAPWYVSVTASRVAYGGTAGPGTVPIRHLLTDTGSFRADTDQYIGRMQAEEAAYRQALTA